MDEKRLLSKLRRCVADYKMIKDGDKIAVGLSGGKDSVSLLKLLARFSTFSDVKFEVVAITVDLAFHGVSGNYAPLQALCDELGVKYVVERTRIGEIVFDVRNESNPCSLCSRMRKGALYAVAKENGCNKVALGHHLDDLTDTFFLSMFYEGRLATFSPKTKLDKTGLTLIRPMLYISEYELKAYSKDLPVVKSKCPVDKKTKREEVKEIVKLLEDKVPDLKTQVQTAILHPERYNLFDKFVNDIDKF